jgi:uncharacterized Rmd1/YagE family protein
MDRGSDRDTTTEEPEDSSIDGNAQTRKMLAMATQDIFYFEYGCVVFWGLSPREEKAAMTELSAFTIDPVSPVELEKRCCF